MEDFYGYKVGDVVEILEQPRRWASFLNNNNPLQIDFPITFTIEKLAIGGDYVAMSGGDYGWDLSTLVKDNIIKIAKNTEPTYEIY